MSDIAEILDSLGITVTGTSHSRRTGALHLTALCPHHYKGTRVDTTPSWDINAESGDHHCHSCGFGGSLEWLIHVLTGVPLAEAKATSGAGARALERVKRLDPWGGDRRIALPPMNEGRIRMYGRAPQWALDARGLSAEAALAYDVRWAEDFIHVEKSYPHCWITPIRHPLTLTAMGMQVKQQGGQRFFRNLPGGVPKSMTLFGIETITDDDTVYIVESPLDAVRLCQIGYTAVASMGAHVTDEQMDLLITRASKVILALDDDDAGRKATYELVGLGPDAKVRPHLQDYSQRIDLYVVDYGYGLGAKDVGDMDDAHAQAVCEHYRPAFALKFKEIR